MKTVTMSKSIWFRIQPRFLCYIDFIIMTAREYGIINTTEHEENDFLEKKKMGTSPSIIIEQVNGLCASHRIAEDTNIHCGSM